MNPSPVQLVTVQNISGIPPANAINVIIKDVLTGYSIPSIDAKGVLLHIAVPIYASRPGEATVGT